jgi:hypothetical protein
LYLHFPKRKLLVHHSSFIIKKIHHSAIRNPHSEIPLSQSSRRVLVIP